MNRLPKRWLLFVAVWLVVFSVAPLRHLAQSQLHHALWPLSLLSGSGETSGSYAELIEQYPDDPQVWSAAIEEYPFTAKLNSLDEYGDGTSEPVPATLLFPGERAKDLRAEQRRRLDIAIEKFPDETWLLAKRLRLSWGHMYGDRVGGELSDGSLYENRAAGIPSPEKTSEASRPNFTHIELQRVLQLCKRGQKLEPNNAFYDWTESYFLALAWRDEEAWRALDSAARKPLFEDHQLKEMRSHMEARELLRGRPLLWEEKLSIASATLFPQFARYREYARITSWQAIKAQKRGDHAQALRLWGALAKTAARMRENSKFHIERLNAVAIQAVAIVGPTWEARRQGAGTARGQRNITTHLSDFSAYAISHGRRDLAQWAEKDIPRAIAARAPVTFNTYAGTAFREAALMALCGCWGCFFS